MWEFNNVTDIRFADYYTTDYYQSAAGSLIQLWGFNPLSVSSI
jgi:hypothetical protein